MRTQGVLLMGLGRFFRMEVLELFSGTESFSKVARERGHNTFSIDNEESFNPNLCKDMNLKNDK